MERMTGTWRTFRVPVKCRHIYPDNTPCIKLGYTTNHDLTEREAGRLGIVVRLDKDDFLILQTNLKEKEQ